MKVKELVAKLNKLDQDLEVICYTEDEEFVSSDNIFRLLDITDIETIEGERTRLKDETPYIKLGKSDISKKMVTLNVTSDF